MDYREGGKEALDLLEELRIMVLDAKGAFGNRQHCQLDRNEVLDLIDEIFSVLPQDISNANVIIREADNLRYKAEEQANRIIEDARKQAEILASEQEVVRIAEIQADAIKDEAEAYSRDIHNGVDDYADEVFYFVETELDKWLANVRANRERFVETSGM